MKVRFFRFNFPIKGREILNLVALIFLCAFLFSFFLQSYKIDFKVPFIYSGDGLGVGCAIKTILDNDWHTYNQFLGAPFGSSLYDFPQVEFFHIILIKIIGLSYKNYAVVLNFFYIITFLTTAFSSYLVLRYLGINFYFSLAGSILYDFLPYHFQRLPHLSLASYFVIPIAIWLGLVVWSKNKSLFYREKPLLYSLFIFFLAILTGSCGVYYAFFGAFLIAISGIIASLSFKIWKPIINASIFISIISATVIISLIPNIIYKLENGPNLEVVQRHTADSEIYGLRITQLVLPSAAHRINWFAEKTQSYNNTAPVINENTTATLGLIGNIGFFFLLMSVFIRERILFDIKIIPQLANLNLACLLLGTMGGLGTLFALLVSPMIRSYNRISVFIAFLSITTAMLVFQKIIADRNFKNPNLAYMITTVLILFIGLFDQTSPAFIPDYATIKQQYENDAQFIQEIEASVSSGTMVYQLPYVEFPERAPLYLEGHYGLIRGYLHSRSLKWSYGAMKGREGDLWLRAMSVLPIEEQIQKIAASGFGGIYVDRRGFKDHAVELESQLKSLTPTAPIISEDGNLAFYLIKSTGNIPVMILLPPSLGKGFYGWEGGSGKFVWSSGDADLWLTNPNKTPINAKLSFELNTLLPRKVLINIGDDQKAIEKILQPEEPQLIHIDVNLKPGKTHVQFKTNTPAQLPGNGDPRKLAFSLRNINIERFFNSD